MIIIFGLSWIASRILDVVISLCFIPSPSQPLSTWPTSKSPSSQRWPSGLPPSTSKRTSAPLAQHRRHQCNQPALLRAVRLRLRLHHRLHRHPLFRPCPLSPCGQHHLPSPKARVGLPVFPVTQAPSLRARQAMGDHSALPRSFLRGSRPTSNCSGLLRRWPSTADSRPIRFAHTCRQQRQQQH